MSIRSLFKIKPAMRPSCEQILKSSLMRYKVHKSNIRDNMDHPIMGIIKVSDSLNSVNSKPKYVKNRS